MNTAHSSRPWVFSLINSSWCPSHSQRKSIPGLNIYTELQGLDITYFFFFALKKLIYWSTIDLKCYISFKWIAQGFVVSFRFVQSLKKWICYSININLYKLLLIFVCFFLIYVFYWGIVDIQCFRCTARWFSYNIHICYFSDYFLLQVIIILTIVPCAIQ